LTSLFFIALKIILNILIYKFILQRIIYSVYISNITIRIIREVYKLKKKIIGIIVCTLIIATFSVPLVGSATINSESISAEPGTLNKQAHYAFSKKGSNMDNLAVTDSVSLVGAENAKIYYLHKYDILPGGEDKGYVKISDNGGSSWTTLWEVQGKLDDWQQNFFELNNWIGKTVKIGFQYITGDNSVSQGWSLDKVIIKVDDEILYEEDFEEYNEGQAWGEWIVMSGEHPENDPPYDPTITGPKRAGENEPLEYSFQATDPDLDQISYYVEWGDGDTSGWTQFFPSGASSYKEDHTYALEGTYTIRAKAKDVNDAESDWTEFKVSIPRSRQANNYLFVSYLENLLELIFKSFPILNKIIGL
jgi:hypothetical protein